MGGKWVVWEIWTQHKWIFMETRMQDTDDIDLLWKANGWTTEGVPRCPRGSKKCFCPFQQTSCEKLVWMQRAQEGENWTKFVKVGLWHNLENNQISSKSIFSCTSVWDKTTNTSSYWCFSDIKYQKISEINRKIGFRLAPSHWSGRVGREIKA